MNRESGIDVLVRFARLASEARTGAAILPLIADALVEHAGAAAVAVLEIRDMGRTSFVPSPHLPPELASLEIEPDVIGEELEAALLLACRGRFARTWSRPLVSVGGLFGSVVLFFTGSPSAERLDLAQGLVDLAAIALGSTDQLMQLTKSHAELRTSQDALARTEKLRALGQMAAGVSHDLKNILNPLSLHLQFIHRAIDRGMFEEAKQSVSECQGVLTRGVENLERLRDYSRQSPESRTEEVDLIRLVREAREIARPRLASPGQGKIARFVEELASARPFYGRTGEILSALVNLLVNAIEAMPEGGTITLRTGESNNESWVSVTDDGPGMPPEVEAHVFEPFFTTKGADGTGLGLAMVYATVQRHGGTLKLETAPGKGTTFTLLFPSRAGSRSEAP